MRTDPSVVLCMLSRALRHLPLVSERSLPLLPTCTLFFFFSFRIKIYLNVGSILRCYWASRKLYIIDRLCECNFVWKISASSSTPRRLIDALADSSSLSSLGMLLEASTASPRNSLACGPGLRLPTEPCRLSVLVRLSALVRTRRAPASDRGIPAREVQFPCLEFSVSRRVLLMSATELLALSPPTRELCAHQS